MTPLSTTQDFEELALPLLDSAYRFALWLVRREADAQDLVQDTYLKAFRAFASFEPGTNFQAWLFRILKNTYLSSLHRAHTRYAAVDLSDDFLADVPSDYLDPLSLLIWQSRREALEAAAERLPPVLYQVLSLCDLGEASYREASEALSIPMGTVMSRLSRARKAVSTLIHSAGHPTNV